MGKTKDGRDIAHPIKGRLIPGRLAALWIRLFVFFFAALGSECVICHGKCCSCPCHQRLEVIPNDCECPADRNAEDVGRVVRPLCLNLARAVVCHAEQSVVAVSDLSKSFAYIGSSFLTEWPFLML